MIQKVLFFLPMQSRYNTLHFFSSELAAAFNSQGVECKLVDFSTLSFPELLSIVRDWDAEVTVSFNGLAPDPKRGFLSEFLGLPHLALLVDPPYRLLPLKDDPYSAIGCVDDSYCKLFKSLSQKHSFPFYHAASSTMTYDENTERPIDLVLLGSFLDYRQLEFEWKETMPKKVYQLLIDVAEATLADTHSSSLEILLALTNSPVKQIETAHYEGYSLLELWYQIECYIRGKDRLELIQALDEHTVHVYGVGWEKAFENPPKHIQLHKALSYNEGLEVLKKSKIALNSVPVFKEGSHERLFVSPCCGAAVLSNETEFIKKNFSIGREILTYSPKDKSGVNALVQQYLSDESARKTLVKSAESLIRTSHTWEQRALQLIELMNHSSS